MIWVVQSSSDCWQDQRFGGGVQTAQRLPPSLPCLDQDRSERIVFSSKTVPCAIQSTYAWRSSLTTMWMTVLDWHRDSADLKLNENLWSCLKQTLSELQEAVQDFRLLLMSKAFQLDSILTFAESCYVDIDINCYIHYQHHYYNILLSCCVTQSLHVQ